MLDFNHRNPSERINSLIDQAILADRWTRQDHGSLGASRLGHPCARALQFEYFNTPKERDFDASALRRFDAGFFYEDLGRKWLQKAGFELITRDGRDRIWFQVVLGRIQGNIDGVILSGPPDTIQFPCLWECKSMEAKEWKKWVKEGVEKWKPLYDAQIQIAMAYCRPAYLTENHPEPIDLTKNPCLMMGINKDAQEIHFELVPFDPATAQRYSDRAAQILSACDAGELLPRITSSQDHFECRYCSFSNRCWSLSL